MQQLEVENARLRDDHPREVSLVDTGAERDQFRKEKEHWEAKAMQLGGL